MPGEFFSDPFPRPETGNEFLAKGKELKTKGHFDAALTEFRRAALANPKLFEAWMEIGALCKMKANSDKMFLRYSYDAFQKATRIDPSKQEAHDQYIVVGQMMGKLEEINEEYRRLTKEFPNEPLIQRCFKNTSTLVMSLIPEKVNFGPSENTNKIKTALFFTSIALILLGAGTIGLPVILIKAFKIKMTAELANQIMRAGIGMIILGIAGVIAKSRIS